MMIVYTNGICAPAKRWVQRFLELKANSLPGIALDDIPMQEELIAEIQRRYNRLYRKQENL